MGKKETINNRVKRLRKSLEMNQDEFAKKIGISNSAISRIEIGDNSLVNHKIILICIPNQLKEGKTVNEKWLRDGTGEMFVTPITSNGRLKLYDENSKELPVDEEELVGIYRQLSKPNKKVARIQIDALLEGQEEVKDISGEKGEKPKSKKLA
ncbi:MAG: helix-turn-helix domain-containing protein [Treponema sp.]|nr:helix-turn-helix domain-containing protein [Treponema sp.]